MNYEQKVLVAFGLFLLVLHMAVRVFIWKRSKAWPDGSKVFLHILWWDMSMALLIGGIVVWLDFMDSWIGYAGMGVAVVGLLSKFATYANLWSPIKRRRTSNSASGITSSQ